MSNFEQFLGGSEKLGEVIPMVSSDMPYIFSASGGTYLRSGYTTPNSGLYDTYVGLTHTDTVVLPYSGETLASSTYPTLLKSGANYINNLSYTTDLTTTWTASTGGSFTGALNLFIVGTTVVRTSPSNSVGMVEYSTNNGVTYTNVTGNNLSCRGAVNAAGTLALVVRATSAATASGDIYTSVDGITWTARTPSIAMGTVYDLIWSPLLSAFVLHAANGLYKTTDGSTITLLIAWAGNVNGDGWSLASSATSILKGDNGLYYRSVDGVSWTTLGYITGLTLFPALYKIYYLNSVYYATGNNSSVYISIDDGLTWERVFLSLNDTYSLWGNDYDIGWVNSTLYVAADTKLKTNPTLTVNGIMAKTKAEPAEGYAYVRIQ